MMSGTLPSSAATPRLSLDEALRCARETRALVVKPGALRETAAIFQQQFPGCRAVVVADEQTFDLAARSVGAALVGAGVGCVAPFIYTDPALYAEMRFVDQLEAALRQHDAIPVAVGSGTINDLVKLASHRAARPAYLCVATAASMDGYTAFGASITYQGAKQTFNCPAPRAVVADIDVIRCAPPEMTASGYADLLAKITAGADWILADAMGAEAIDPRAWAIVQGGLRDALADPAGARAGKATAIAPLVEGLMLGGFAMQWSKTSRPASGAEHQFSHLWDMEHHTHNGEAPSHGFKVGVATLAVTALYEQLLAQPFEELDVAAAVAAWPDAKAAEARARKLFAGEEFVETAVTETLAKQISRTELQRQLETLRQSWSTTRGALRAQLLPVSEVKQRLHAVGAPIEPEQIGLTRERVRASFIRAQHIRRRFTVLDLALRTGTLDRALNGIFGPGGMWATSPTPTR
jgi:glycerol-1-phosphate dehydrogenase [NAD(P)+]